MSRGQDERQRRGSELFTAAEKMAASTPVFMNTPPATPAQSSILPKPPDSSTSSASASASGQTPMPAQMRSQMQTQSASPAIQSALNNKPVACVRCKQKKIKCDGKTPSCSACVRASEQCLIPDMVTGRAYPRGYIEHLENRVLELQSIIDTRLRESRVAQHRESSISSYYTGSPVTSDPFTPGKRSSATSLQQGPGEVTLSPREENQADLALARLIVQTLHLKDHGPCISKLSYLVSNDGTTAAQGNPAAGRLPPQNLCNTLVNLYLKNEHRCFPFLPQREIYSSLRRVYANAGIPDLQPPTPQDYFQIFMIFAIASLSQAQSEDPTSAGFSYYNSALHYVGRLSLMSGLSAVQNLLLLCLFSLNAKISQDAWRLSRRALHICIQDELHLSRTRKGSNVVKSKDETKLEQLKQRIFWSSYCLNRITSNLMYDRPPSIPDAEIDIEQPPETEQTFTSPPTSMSEDLKESKSLLPHLANLYHLSTVAFTSFNSNPLRGDVTENLKQYIEEFLDGNRKVLEEFHSEEGEEEEDELPVYVRLSYGAHPMLIFQWAVTSLVAQKGGLPSDIQNLALNYCVETLTFIADTTSKSYQCANSRISYIITLRTLLVMLSASLAQTIDDEGHADIQGDKEFNREKLDKAVVTGVDYLIDFGKRFGHGNSFVAALGLALRYGIFERERRELQRERGSSEGSVRPVLISRKGKEKQTDRTGAKYRDNRMDTSQDVTEEQEEEEEEGTLFMTSNDEYSDIIPYLAERYPLLFQLFERLQIHELPINIDLTALDATPEVPAWIFKKFGSCAGDLEVLCKQVIWRLKVQYGIGDIEGQLHAFDVRLGSRRPVEPWPQVGVGSSFNEGGQDIGPREVGDVEMGDVDRGEEMYQPISGWMGGGMGGEGWGMPKMDVDFSGFDTNIVTFD
ncbi:hypothetical protein H072_6041 [Dactylellina haptotyla CBS 200.50]|uniref:Zn(2)-C6 fungal-type domain-containing protein n=1 Tax=Dactylellina haptotyla (strain CBS 200.50) TaxID=1284197 RepID=S8BXU9_DACHA|nr:hypothetical protein H072_6041 [Dactylellina haptotyla CBS 200.50]